MAAFGASGLSLELGAYNTSHIASLKEAVELLSTGGLVNTNVDNVDTPSVTPIIDETRAETIRQTTFSASDSSEIIELQTKLSDHENIKNNVGTRSTTNANNTIIKGDELARLSDFVTDSLVEVRARTSSSENSMLNNASSSGILESSMQDITLDASTVNEKIDTGNSITSNLDSALDVAIQQINAAEENAIQISTSVTDVSLVVDALGDKIDLVAGFGTDTKESLENLYDSWNAFFNATAFICVEWENECV